MRRQRKAEEGNAIHNEEIRMYMEIESGGGRRELGEGEGKSRIE